jgi:ribosomal protein S12 methylthiotransferase
MPAEGPRLWLTTLGCAKNEVDSEKLSLLLAEAGFGAAPSPEEADAVLVNTCAFIETARRESIDAVLDLAARKRADAVLVVIGCMAQRYQGELAEALPEVDDVIGIERYGELAGRLGEMTGFVPGGPASTHMDILYGVRRPTPSMPYAYVKVAEGCDKSCTFCAIPQFRGRQRSRRPVEIVSEVESLVADGVGEIVLVAQDLGAYGRDIAAAGGLVGLIRYLAEVQGLRRLRGLYLHPREIGEGLIAEMAGNPVVASYFDLSLQHAAGSLLRAMMRPGDGPRHLELIGRIRAADPEAALRSSFIVGFPGETDDDVEELAEFLRSARLDWAGFFPFSPEEGTRAALLPDRVDPEETGDRLRYLSGIQEEVTAERNAEQVGRVLEVIVDQVEEGTAVARSYREAPEIDGMVLLDRGDAGQWLQARITGAYGSDTSAEVVS